MVRDSILSGTITITAAELSQRLEAAFFEMPFDDHDAQMMLRTGP